VRKPGRKRSAVTFARAFGERLHRYREDRGLSQRQLAALVGVDPVQIGRYEKGTTLPAADTVAALAEGLQISLDTLLRGKADRMAEALPVRNLPLLQRFQEVEKLDRRNQQVIIEVIDSILARADVESRIARHA
jgi:transcriptional regulator with XRE-family HTH domain